MSISKLDCKVNRCFIAGSAGLGLADGSTLNADLVVDASGLHNCQF